MTKESTWERASDVREIYDVLRVEIVYHFDVMNNMTSQMTTIKLTSYFKIRHI